VTLVPRRKSLLPAAAARAAAATLAALTLTLAMPPRSLASSAPAPPALSVRAATLFAPFTGQQLFGINPGSELAIASTTKLMTVLVTLQHASLKTTFTAPNTTFPGVDSQIGLSPGERMTVRDLLEAMLLPSADDAAYDLAYNVSGGSVPRFISMMNADARRLGLTQTHYSTPIGLDTPGNYSSADDLVRLANYLLTKYPTFAHIVGMSSAVLRSGNHVRDIVNLNDLVARYPWIHGVKTGHTADAGYVLVAAANQNGMTLLSAVLGTDSAVARDQNTLALLEWGFANYRLATPVHGGQTVARPTVADRPGFHAQVIAARSFRLVIPRSDHLHTRLKLPHQLTGPLSRHAVVGSLTVLDGTKVVGRMSVLLAHRLPAVSPVTIAARFLAQTSTLLLLVALLGGGLVLARYRRGQRVTRSTPA
jgi:D-alanyl-D-alanine carboxypeptidase (penicillin-binding protein 5/6)